MKPESNNNKKFPDMFETEKVIDPLTGSDITAEYVNQRLKELEIIAEKIIKLALESYKKNPDNKKEIYEKAYGDIHEKLGMGSIGPATALASPLMSKKKNKLADLLDIELTDRLL
jgi:hypothetical protein